mmetsp:Transcript_6054/g.16258  ORF Transcript_6054/g.16258 Transcript_6054/m.16258 type:complete len:97 (+) Transcript_6054:3-293(+)
MTEVCEARLDAMAMLFASRPESTQQAAIERKKAADEKAATDSQEVSRRKRGVANGGAEPQEQQQRTLEGSPALWNLIGQDMEHIAARGELGHQSRP